MSEKKTVIVKVTATEFQTQDGRTYLHPIPFEKGSVPTVETFQKIYDKCQKVLRGSCGE